MLEWMGMVCLRGWKGGGLASGREGGNLMGVGPLEGTRLWGVGMERWGEFCLLIYFACMRLLRYADIRIG